MTIVHVTDQIGTFYFKRFKGSKSLIDAMIFCCEISNDERNLNAYISQTSN